MPNNAQSLTDLIAEMLFEVIVAEVAANKIVDDTENKTSV